MLSHLQSYLPGRRDGVPEEHGGEHCEQQVEELVLQTLVLPPCLLLGLRLEKSSTGQSNRRLHLPRLALLNPGLRLDLPVRKPLLALLAQLVFSLS